MKPAYSVIKRPLITEKSSGEKNQAQNKYTFEVYPTADRAEVAQAIAAQFKVKVNKVNILNVKGKVKPSRQQRGLLVRTSDVKKAIVTLEKGDKIDFA
ncbi:MAG: 50S ribosomal protein L23 [Puniceicoccales bacterium]|jgi:large subunit ribosomal protein L23|nr:50S ribosomal protein L23 [Puniceicoccales bacterium]